MNKPWIPTTQKGLFGNYALWVLGALALVGILTVSIWGFNWVTAPFSGQVSARTQINSGSFRIAAYNHFFDACASIQGLQGQLTAQRDELKIATGSDRDRVQANIAGIEGDIASSVAEYNADAAKNYTIGQFKSKSLPFHLDPSEAITCVA